MFDKLLGGELTWVRPSVFKNSKNSQKTLTEASGADSFRNHNVTFQECELLCLTY